MSISLEGNIQEEEEISLASKARGESPLYNIM